MPAWRPWQSLLPRGPQTDPVCGRSAVLCGRLFLPFSCRYLIAPRSLPGTVGPRLKARSSVPRVSRELAPLPSCVGRLRVDSGFLCSERPARGCAWHAPGREESDGVRVAEGSPGTCGGPGGVPCPGFWRVPVRAACVPASAQPCGPPSSFPCGDFRCGPNLRSGTDPGGCGITSVPARSLCLLSAAAGMGLASGPLSVLAGFPGDATWVRGPLFLLFSLCACFDFVVKSMGRYSLPFSFF